MDKTVIIMGTARNDGETTEVVNDLHKLTSWKVINLNEYKIAQYDYKHENRDDDFLPLMHKILSNYELLVFVTPVYWYAMSGVMKKFFDRFSDLLTIEKDLGRQFRGKKMAALSCSYGNNLGDNFWLPFQHSADYLGMEFLGGIHLVMNDYDEKMLSAFIRDLRSNS